VFGAGDLGSARRGHHRPHIQLIAPESVRGARPADLRKNLADLWTRLRTVIEGGLDDLARAVEAGSTGQRDAPSGADEPGGEALSRAGVDLQRQAAGVRVEGHVVEHHARRRVEVALLDRVDQ